MSRQFSHEWMEKFRDIVNRDGPFKNIGKHCNARFLVGIDDKEYLVVIEKGRVESISPSHIFDFDANWAFALRGPHDSWAKFVQPVPPPTYTDVIFMTFNQRIRLEGNLMVFWQNIRALLWMFALMRNVDQSIASAHG
jgi:hypothetical protein